MPGQITGGYPAPTTGTGDWVRATSPTLRGTTNIVQVGTTLGLKITGTGYAGGVANDDGVCFLLGYNDTGDRHFWIGDTAGVGNAAAYFLRIIAGPYVRLDGITGTGGASAPIIIGNTLTIEGSLSVGGGTAILKSAKYSVDIATTGSILGLTYVTLIVTATGLAEGDTIAASLPTLDSGLVYSGLWATTNEIHLSIFNTDAISAHTPSGTAYFRTFEE